MAAAAAAAAKQKGAPRWVAFSPGRQSRGFAFLSDGEYPVHSKVEPECYCFFAAAAAAVWCRGCC